jgi:hypothetical protein
LSLSSEKPLIHFFNFKFHLNLYRYSKGGHEAALNDYLRSVAKAAAVGDGSGLGGEGSSEEAAAAAAVPLKAMYAVGLYKIKSS